MKTFGTILLVLGIFTAVCTMYANSCIVMPNNYLSYSDLQLAYKMGMLMGASVAEMAIGSLLLFKSN